MHAKSTQKENWTVMISVKKNHDAYLIKADL